MTVNDFNTKVNLPKFCAKMGITDYQFVRMPTFGWFAYNKDKSFIGNIFDVVGQKGWDSIYETICKDKPEFLDFTMPYNEVVGKTLRNNLLNIQLWTAAYVFSKKEFETYKLGYKGKLFKDVLIENGFNPVLVNNMGVINRNVLERFNMLPWPKKELRSKLLIPTFHTPNHISSLDCCSWDNPSEMTSLFVNHEKGWYGNIKHKKFVSSLFDLWTHEGCTWDYKCDYWTGDEVFDLGETLDIPDCIRIWSEVNNTKLVSSPLDHILDTGKTEELKHYAGMLSLKQLEEIEQRTGEKLNDYWKKARETQVKLGHLTFVRRDNSYYVYRKGNLEQITNFAVDIERIVKRGDKFVRTGIFYLGNSSVPFEMNEEDFVSSRRLHQVIKEKFISSGLGIPILFPLYANRLLLLIESFNSSPKIELEDVNPEKST